MRLMLMRCACGKIHALALIGPATVCPTCDRRLAPQVK